MTDREAKQVIVIRRDLKMRRGKEIAQGAHASMAWLSKRLGAIGGWSVTDVKDGAELFQAEGLFTEAEHAWLTGPFAKITLQVSSEEELLALWRKACDAGLEAHLIRDSGRTEFHGVATYTALAIGPDWGDLIGPVTSDLKLY